MSASDQPANPGRARTTSRLRWIVGFSILGLILALGAVIFLEADSTSSGWAPGTIFVANDNNTLTVIRPDRSIRTTIKLSGAPFGLAIAPPGTPNAGTVYVSNPNGLDVIEPGSAKITSHVALPCTPKVKVRGPSSEGICGAGGLSADLVVAPAGAPNAGTVYVGGNWTSFGAATIGHTEGKVWAYVPGKSTVSTITFPDPLMTLAIAPQGASNVGTVYSATETQALSSITATTQVVQTHALSQADGTYTFLGVAPTGTPSVGDVYLWRNRYPTEVVQILHGGSTANVKSTTIPAQVNTAEVAPLGAPNAGVTYLAAESTYSQQ
ncbi:MAG TPA: hypothetical protein VN108_07170, partial [Marmoricola sp.]|nr:hypothetical protein [Marmoricola sp.]